LKTEPAKWMRSKRPEERARGRVCATERASARRSWFGFSAWYQNGADSSRAVGRENKTKKTKITPKCSTPQKWFTVI